MKLTLLVTLGALVLTGCGDSARLLWPAPVYLDGTWAWSIAVPDEDFAEQWTLDTHGADVAGTGRWHRFGFIDNPGSGELAVTGSVTGDSLHLDVQYFNGTAAGGALRSTAHFTGVLASPTELKFTIPSGDAFGDVLTQVYRKSR